MHRLEQRITDWRKGMTDARGVGRETLEELENHLREMIDEHLRSGFSENEAFQRAVAQVGSPPAISSEFGKLTHSMWWPVKVGIGLGLAAAIAMAMLMIARFDGTGISLLLAVHVFTVTLGYLSMFLIGGVAICFVLQRCFSEFSPARLESLSRSSFMFGIVAAFLSAIGIGLGMIWAKIEWGRFWGWDAKEVGAFCVIAWLVFFITAQRSRKVTARGVMLLAIFGNVVVSLAWFGANMVSNVHSYGTPGFLTFVVGAGLNFAFLLIGLAPPGWLRLRKV
jgi:cytochrome c assembly protein